MDFTNYRAVQNRKLPPLFKFLIKPVELLLLPVVVRLPLQPNLWTLLSLAANLLAVIWIYLHLPWGWIPLWLYLSLLFDGFDGAVARWRNQTSLVGACADTLTDIFGSSLLIAAAGAYWLSTTTDPARAGRLIVGVIFLEILYQTTLVCRAISGNLLKQQISLPAWNQWLEDRNILPFYFIDSLFLIIAVGPLLFSFQTVFSLLLLYQAISLIYLLLILFRAALQHPRGATIIRGIITKLLLRAGFFMIFIHAVPPLFLAPLRATRFPWLITGWLEYWIFYCSIIILLKQGRIIPRQEPQRSSFLAELTQKNMQFFQQWYP